MTTGSPRALPKSSPRLPGPARPGNATTCSPRRSASFVAAGTPPTRRWPTRSPRLLLAELLSVQHIDIDDGEMGEPAQLRRRDGTSVHSRHGSATYTSQELLAAERRIVAAALRRGGRTVEDIDIELALADSAARDKQLNEGQVALVREMASSGRRVALALAPAGTGRPRRWPRCRMRGAPRARPSSA